MTAYVIVECYGFSVELPVQEFFGPVLAKFCYQYTRNAYLHVKRFQKSESTPFNPSWIVVVLQSVNYLAVGKVRLHTGFYLQMARCCHSRSVPTIFQQSTGHCNFIKSYTYLCFESV